jgi:sulfatase maturation enzyme AslB (radical SAM superfamily)
LLMKSWLNSIWFYFNSFDENKQKIITNNWIILKNLLENIILIKNSWIFYKTIIHINKQNISSIANDVLILYKKFLVKNFEFVNYFPFDRPHEKYKDLLEYDIETERKNIDKLFLIIKKEGLNAKFIKFEKNFFWKFVKYYDFERWVLEQILEEDKERLAIKNPFCLMENRCKACFIKDNCNTYEN